MDDELTRRLRRWSEADEGGRDDEADGACHALFQGLVREPVVSSGFTGRTLAAVADAAARDRRRARRTKIGVTAAGISAAALTVYVGGPWALAGLSRLVARTIDLLVRLAVALASSVETGTDVWTVLASVGRALAAFVSDPAVTIAIFAMQGIAMAALAALHRLLGSDRESLK